MMPVFWVVRRMIRLELMEILPSHLPIGHYGHGITACVMVTEIPGITRINTSSECCSVTCSILFQMTQLFSLYLLNKINLGICIAPTYSAAL
ncbi:hypothetical protein GDO78_004007 [Eleutherodactylus coqui]|uniref:Uncharacterized protein n=1 Tax=Eleutherodactylus coqui TaxID=57060 RepID=A0A8J6K1D2_ELECQ|nr:hypothetical protein GDO78_004007 [Eleutherodactylus coqui]